MIHAISVIIRIVTKIRGVPLTMATKWQQLT